MQIFTSITHLSLHYKPSKDIFTLQRLLNLQRFEAFKGFVQALVCGQYITYILYLSIYYIDTSNESQLYQIIVIQEYLYEHTYTLKSIELYSYLQFAVSNMHNLSHRRKELKNILVNLNSRYVKYVATHVHIRTC